MVETYSFGTWIKQRRKEMRLTQRELAIQAACAVATVKKIEADERRPSVEIAELLADGLSVPKNWRERFVACARGQRPVDTLAGMGTGEQTDGNKLLPTPRTPFIGRDNELAEIERLISNVNCRLLTLVGPGGIGKTRLAIECGYRLNDIMEDGSVFVHLATVTESSAILTTIIHSLNLSLSSEEQLFNALKQLQIVLILDNCEQLGDEVAWLTRLLDRVPNIKVMTTSRERLNLRGEWVFSVPEMAQQHAVALLQSSGQRTVSDLDISEDEAISVCQVVENLPLAVELAAGWLSFMSCEQIVQSIQRDVDFLATNMRDIPERHRSIRAVFDYSWKMLSEQEQNVLMCLSVFRGGWRSTEAEIVAGASLPLLRTLVDKSLVRSMGQGRYDLHELIRQYVAEKLRESGLENEVHERHAEVYIQFCENVINPDADTKGQKFRLVETELENCRAILRWSLDNAMAETALRLLAGTFHTWFRMGHWQEGEHWHQETLLVAGDLRTNLVCEGLTCLATFTAVQGRYAQAFPIQQKARSMLKDIDDIKTQVVFAVQAIPAERELKDARKWFDKLVSILPDWEHSLRDSQVSAAYGLMADRYRNEGYYAQARELYLKAMKFDEEVRGFMSPYMLGNLGRLELQAGNLQEAYNLISQSVALSRTSGERVSIADWTRCLGEVLLYTGRLQEAEINFEESLALYEEIGNIRATTDLNAYLVHTAILQENWNSVTERLRVALSLYAFVLNEFRSLASGHGLEQITPFINALFCTALLCAYREQYEEATPIVGCAILFREKDPMRSEPQLQALTEEKVAKLRNILGENRYSILFEKGQSMVIRDVLDYAIDCLKR